MCLFPWMKSVQIKCTHYVNVPFGYSGLYAKTHFLTKTWHSSNILKNYSGPKIENVLSNICQNVAKCNLLMVWSKNGVCVCVCMCVCVWLCKKEHKIERVFATLYVLYPRYIKFWSMKRVQKLSIELYTNTWYIKTCKIKIVKSR